MRWALISSLAGAVIAGGCTAEFAQACAISGGMVGIAASIESATVFRLQTGETVVLAGAWPSQAGPVMNETWPAQEDMRRDLERLVSGRTIDIVTSDRRYDRYGRLLAQVFVEADDSSSEKIWIQGELIAAGLARAYALQGTVACLDEMLALEAGARADRRGHWGSGVFVDREASDVRRLRGLRDTFQSVVGVVARVDKVRGQPGLVFEGRDGQEFRALLASNIKEAGARGRTGARRPSLDGLTGQRVRVRGWIENRTRPFLVLADPMLIEVIEPLEGKIIAVPPAPRDAKAIPTAIR